MPHHKGRKIFPFDSSGNYCIRVLGYLDESWSETLGGLRIKACSPKNQEGSVTELIGKVRDQAELAGSLNSLYELHLSLFSVEMQNAD